jgi:hypothetical protein
VPLGARRTTVTPSGTLASGIRVTLSRAPSTTRAWYLRIAVR